MRSHGVPIAGWWRASVRVVAGQAAAATVGTAWEACAPTAYPQARAAPGRRATGPQSANYPYPVAILPIVITPDPVLHTRTEPVTEVTQEIRTLVADMFETMDAAPGVGLAAPQVGVGLALFTYSYVDDEDKPWRGVVINPQLWNTPLTPGEPDPEDEEEGCLSFPGERFPLRRSDHTIVTGTDLDGAQVRLEVTGWRARILQHEFDHLLGYLYTDRLPLKQREICQKIKKKRGWTEPGLTWTPGVDEVGEG